MKNTKQNDITLEKILIDFIKMPIDKRLETINYLIVKQKDDIVVSRFYNEQQLTDKLMKQLDILNKVKTHFEKLLAESN